MVLAFTTNIATAFYDPMELVLPEEVGWIVLFCGSLLFGCVLFYLRSGFLGDTEPVLDFLVTKGPYRFCRHPQYLAFIIMILGFDFMFRSFMGILFTCLLSVPSAVYRGKVEDKLLRKKFGNEWKRYAEHTGFLFPNLGRLKLRRQDEQ